MFGVDTLLNVVSGLFTRKDKKSFDQFVVAEVTQQELLAAYRGDWIARKIVDIPPYDATREWRDWQAKADQIKLIEAEEERLNVRRKVTRAMSLARLYGGAIIFIGSGDGNPETELRTESIARGGLRYLHVLHRWECTAGEVELDPLSEWYGQPQYYEITSAQKGSVRIHPSRVVRFIGAERPDFQQSTDGWGDSILQAAMDAVKHAALTAGGIASLVHEAKVDVIKLPNFMEELANAGYSQRLLERFTLVNSAKSMHNMLLLDKEDEFEQKQVGFAQMPEVMNTFLQMVSGAADIPATRLLGQSPAGMNSTGDSDIRNYYDRISGDQNLTLRPALARLDDAILRSALGSRPAEVYYTWAPLWQATEVERADIGLKKAQAVKTIADTGLLPDEAFGRSVANMLIEDGTYPGLDQGIADLSTGGEDVFATMAAEAEAAAELEQRAALAVPDKTRVGDAEPRSLYVSRPLRNAKDLIRWAKAQGFAVTVPADEMHVTIVHSRQPLDWMKVGEAWGNDKSGGMSIAQGGARLVEGLGDKGAIVLLFASSELQWRHRAIVEAGASHDFDDYQPHVTFTYERGDVDLEKVEPYRGPLAFGPEIFEEIDEDDGGGQAADLPFLGDAFNPNQPRDPHGRWTSSGAGEIAARILSWPADRTYAEALGEVENVAAITAATGIDVTGFARVLDSGGLRHALNRHGNEVATGTAQVSITVADFGLIPRIVAAGRIITARRKKQNPTVTYEADIGRHRYTYVEEVRRKARQVATKTMWKTRK